MARVNFSILMLLGLTGAVYGTGWTSEEIKILIMTTHSTEFKQWCAMENECKRHERNPSSAECYGAIINLGKLMEPHGFSQDETLNVILNETFCAIQNNDSNADIHIDVNIHPTTTVSVSDNNYMENTTLTYTGETSESQKHIWIMAAVVIGLVLLITAVNLANRKIKLHGNCIVSKHPVISFSELIN